MPHFKDQTGRSVFIPDAPQKIVSLVPSITELLCALGSEPNIAGITRYCIHPEHLLLSKAVVGGTKKTVPKRISELQPALIIASKEENIRKEVEEYAQQYPVWVSDVRNMDTALQMISEIGKITGTIEKAQNIIHTISSRFQALPSSQTRARAAYFIWKDPFMTVGSDTFIHDMMEKAGLENVFAHRTRYPIVTLEEIAEAAPDVILLSSEPYPFREEEAAQMRSATGIPAILVDGTYFSWYGSRMTDAPGYFSNEILPSLPTRE